MKISNLLITSVAALSLFSLTSVSTLANAASSPTTPPTIVKKIDLNQADAKTLAKALKGIGKKRAAAIVAYRQQHGAFHSVADLANVDGIGKTFLASHQQQLTEVLLVNP